MTYRLYLGNKSPDVPLPAVKGTWTDSSAATTGLLDLIAGNAATMAVASAATNVQFMNGRWQSLPITRRVAFSTGDTVQYVVGATCTSTTNSVWHFRVHIFVIQPDASTVRGTLLANFTGAGTAFTTTATGRTDSTQSLSNNVTAEAGDRIVVEIGYARTGTSTASRSATYNYGNTGIIDLTSTDTNVTTRPGWVEFSTPGLNTRPLSVANFQSVTVGNGMSTGERVRY